MLYITNLHTKLLTNKIHDSCRIEELSVNCYFKFCFQVLMQGVWVALPFDWMNQKCARIASYFVGEGKKNNTKTPNVLFHLGKRKLWYHIRSHVHTHLQGENVNVETHTHTRDRFSRSAYRLRSQKRKNFCSIKDRPPKLVIYRLPTATSSSG